MRAPTSALTLSGPNTASAGSTQVFQLRVDNFGPDASPASSVSYSIPPGLTIPTPPAGCSIGGATLTCTVGALALNGNRIFSVTGVVSAGNGSTLTHAASVIAGGGVGDGVASNNAATLNTAVTPGSAVSVNKSKSVADPVVTGSDFNFLLDARYSGDYPTGVALNDPLPANFCVVGPTNFTSGAWSCTASSSCPAAGATVACTRSGTGAAGYNQTLGMVTIPVRALTPVVGANNTATVSAPGVTPANGSVATTVTDPISDLRANKSQELAAGGDPGQPGLQLLAVDHQPRPDRIPRQRHPHADGQPAGRAAGRTASPRRPASRARRLPASRSPDPQSSPATAPTSRSRSMRPRPRSRSTRRPRPPERR